MPDINVAHRQPIAAFWYTTLGPLLLAICILYFGIALATSSALETSGVQHLETLIATLSVLISILSVAYPVLHYIMFTYEISEHAITINSGIIFRQHETINFNRVQSIENERGPILMLFGLTLMEVWTASPNQQVQSHIGLATPDTAILLQKDVAHAIKNHMSRPSIVAVL